MNICGQNDIILWMANLIWRSLQRHLYTFYKCTFNIFSYFLLYAVQYHTSLDNFTSFYQLFCRIIVFFVFKQNTALIWFYIILLSALSFSGLRLKNMKWKDNNTDCHCSKKKSTMKWNYICFYSQQPRAYVAF